MNLVILCGHLGRDPELRYTQSGVPVASFSLATSSKKKQGDAYVDLTEWHNVVFWNKRAEVAAKHLSKGSRVLVHGEIRTRKYADKNGVDRYITEIVGNSLEFLGGKATKGDAPLPPAGTAPATPSSSLDLDDIPF